MNGFAQTAVSGPLIVAMAVAALAGVVSFLAPCMLPWLGPTWRLHRLPRAGLVGAPALGAVFALSWTPCLSPTLAVVLALAATQGSAGRGVVLAAAYSLGMGLPFIVFGLAYGRALRWTRWLRARGRRIAQAGGMVLIGVGVALVGGWWGEFLNWLRATVGPGQIGI